MMLLKNIRATIVLISFLAMPLSVSAQGTLEANSRPSVQTESQSSAQPNLQPSAGMNAQASPQSSEEKLPLRRLTLFSSGVGFFEHSASVYGSVELILPFNIEAVNDVLKSLVINDPDSSATVSYPSEETLYRTLRSLSVNLLENPSIPALLESLKGAEIEVLAPNPVRGRIILVEHRFDPSRGNGMQEPFLSLFTTQGIRVIGLSEINTFSFSDPQINADLNRALDLIMQSSNADTRNLTVNLRGQSERDVSVSYVIPTPVWKVSYRLDLSQENPFLQGWAIVDNDSDTDWNNVELSLVTGRPVSFIQNLYPPYRVARPVVPLSIAGVAAARTHASGTIAMQDDMRDASSGIRESSMRVQAEMAFSDERAYAMSAPQPSPASGNVTRGNVDAAEGRAAGEQFSFTVRNPVTIARQHSAMLPLIEGSVQVERTLVFSGVNAVTGRTINPSVSAELTNNTGMKLPAGPVTVFDDGTYAGDALLDFFPEGERRLISYGEDLSVSGSIRVSTRQNITAVTIQRGVMTISRKQIYERVYSFRNASNAAKRLIVEHPVTSGTHLVMPASYAERTDSLYRFTLNLPHGETSFTVTEELPLSQTISLSQLNLNTLVSYAGNGEIPENVRAFLQRAIELKRIADDARQVVVNLQNNRRRLVEDQDRTRRNLEAAGSQTETGQNFLRRLIAQENDIDALDIQIASAEQSAQSAQNQYESALWELL